jgi:hypothetical protein
MESRESPSARYRFKIEHARQVERVGRLSPGQTIAASLGTTLGSILSGATAYGSGVNVGLGAERLELAAARLEQG